MRQRMAFKRISVTEAQAVIAHPEVRVFDVRDADAFAQTHIQFAQNISITNLSEVLRATPKTTPILIYCYHGHASQEYAQIFSDFGFLEVYSLDGGHVAWTNRQTVRHRVQNDLLDQWLEFHGFLTGRVDLPIGNGTTPLMQASHSGRTDIMRLLIVAGASLNARNHDGNNALWLACVGGHPAAINALLEAGIDLNNQNDNGATPLMYAASTGKSVIVEQLLRAKADTSLETLDGFTVLDMAANGKCLTLLRQTFRVGVPAV
ncbi:MAG: ankyrin repeat domain-containing protein [Acidiphilium sp.]|nr:ankyrin repeat domain-containing protein [Acidiphilium sp.]MDD4935126.1 ankyrin repeat domain-containing protein [Acidiphilium sp.]